MIKKVLIPICLLLILVLPVISYAVPTPTVSADGLSGMLDWTDEQRDIFDEIVDSVEREKQLTEQQRIWVEEHLIGKLEAIPSVSNNRKNNRYREIDMEELLSENTEHLDLATLGPVYKYNGGLDSINFKVTSTKRSSEEHWDLGSNMYFDIGPYSIKIGTGDRISYEWWHLLWEEVSPGITIPHVYTIDIETLKLSLANQYGLSIFEAEEILEYPYARKFPPYIEMRTDIEIFNPNIQENFLIRFDEKEKATQQYIYDQTGIWFIDTAIADIQSRFQTIEIEVPKININVHHIEAEEKEGGANKFLSD